MYTLITAGAAALLSFTVSAQQLDLIKNMCVRFDHQSMIKNNTLYIDGGIETFKDTTKNGTQVGNITVGYNEQLIAIDVSKPWDWKTNISEKVIVKGVNPKTGTDVPFLSRGALYHGMDDDENIYLWGGTTSYLNTSFPGWVTPYVSTYSLWSYSIISKQWDQHDVTQYIGPRRPSSASSAEAPDLGLAFYFNGEMDAGSEKDSGIQGADDKVFLEGMIVIDTQNQTAKNISTAAVVGDTPRTRGGMQYVPGVGEKGVLVQIGGNQKPVGVAQDELVGDLVPMDQIDIFDVASLDNPKPDGVWYKQRAGGDVPAGRIDFCLFLATAADNSSYNIYLYGGRGANEKFFDDMYILSLPSFTWIKLYEGTSPRFGHTCHQVGVRSLLTVGGIVDNNLTGQACDWEYRGVGVMDISTLTWGSVFNPNPDPYEVPRLVFDDIGGTGQGKATKLTPTAGFSSKALAGLFPSNSPRQHKRPITAIVVGSVIGSLALLGVVSTAVYLNQRRIRRYFNGDPNLTPEMGESKTRIEIMGKDAFWELDAQQDRRSSMRENTHALRPPGSDGERRLVAELEVEKSVAELEVEKSVAELEVEKSVAELEVEKSVAELEVEKSVAEFEVQKSAAELEVQKPVTKLKCEGGEKEADQKAERSIAVLAVKKSAESLERNKDGRSTAPSNGASDDECEIEVVRMGTTEHNGPEQKQGGCF